MSHSSDPGFWQWLIGTVLGFFSALFGYHKFIDSKISKKADKSMVDKIEEEIKSELTIHRGYFKDVFNQLRENEQRAQDRHERLLERLTGERK